MKLSFDVELVILLIKIWPDGMVDSSFCWEKSAHKKLKYIFYFGITR